VRLILPPLRERKEDIPLLAQHFIRKFNLLTGREIEGLSPEALAILMSHDFPGNVRELENIVEYATVICKEKLIGVEHLPDYLRPFQRTNALLALDEKEDSHSFEKLERSFLINALKRHHWNRKSTAQALGIHPTTLWRKMKRLKIHGNSKS
ncbi:MAG: Fis family transcriptional regulator, partial [Deltaproteobacteria bacterium]